MLFATLHLTAVLLFLFGGRLAAAMPTTTTDHLERRIDPDDIFMYSVDVSYCWTISQQLRRKLTVCPQFFIKAALNKPSTGTCLFYTQGLTQKAQEFALQQNLFTIWVRCLAPGIVSLI
jgi:hypothetical protein